MCLTGVKHVVAPRVSHLLVRVAGELGQIEFLLLSMGPVLIGVAFPAQSLLLFLRGTLCAGFRQGLAYMGR